MIEQTARVIELEKEHVWLEPNTQSSCQSCSSQSTCGTSLIGKIFNHKDKKIRVENSCAAQVGDMVVIGMSEKAMLMSSLMIYLLPLILLFGFTGFAVFFSSLSNLGSGLQDLLVILLALVSFIVSYFVLKKNPYFLQSKLLEIKMLRLG